MLENILKNKKAVTGLIMMVFLVGAAVSAPVVSPHDPYKPDVAQRLKGPSRTFILGNDHLGRCVLSRMLYGGRLSLEIAVVVVAVQMVTGLLMGALSGYAGGMVDGMIMRLIDIFMALPSLVLALVIAALTGPGLWGITLALCLTGWTEYARVARGDVLSLKEREFIKSARAFGFSAPYILIRHIIPNIMAPILVLATLSAGFTILLVAAFSFIGIGAQPPLADWGAMLSEGRPFMRSAPHLTIFPGMAIMFTTLAFYLFGDALRDIMDPRYKPRRMRFFRGMGPRGYDAD